MFFMNDEETIYDMYDRFITIVNCLKNIRKPQLQEDLNRRSLMALPPHWISKIVAIEESKDLAELPIDELIGSLLTYEIGVGKAKVIASRILKKTVALKSAKQEIVQKNFEDEEKEE